MRQVIFLCDIKEESYQEAATSWAFPWKMSKFDCTGPGNSSRPSWKKSGIPLFLPYLAKSCNFSGA
jgi:hypothetical protein